MGEGHGGHCLCVRPQQHPAGTSTPCSRAVTLQSHNNNNNNSRNNNNFMVITIVFAMEEHKGGRADPPHAQLEKLRNSYFKRKFQIGV